MSEQPPPEELAFRKVVEHIFNNWTALRLCVEHSMGGPDSKQTALDFINYTTSHCLYDKDNDIDGIQDMLDDLLEQEFETICEDNSTKEIATVLHHFQTIIQAGNAPLYEDELKKLPTANEWLVKTQSKAIEPPPAPLPVQTAAASSSSTDAPMEEDSEWTEVKSKRTR